MSDGVRRVAIVGRDAGAWLSALTLHKGFAGTGVAIELVELPSALGPQDVYVTLPAQHAFHDLLGLDEHGLLRACAGLFTLGQRYSNWSGAAAPFLHAYDTHGIELNHVPFFQYWLEARANGLDVPLEDFSLGAAAAKQGRFVILNETTRSYSSAAYGYHLSALPYLHAIGRLALGAGVEHRVSRKVAVETSGDTIRSVTLDDGTRIAADLFVDASGREGALISHLDDDEWESWSRWLPCDRMAVAAAPALNPAPSFAEISAFAGGWLGIYPLMDRCGLIAGYSSGFVRDAEIPEIIAALSGLKIEGELLMSAIGPGTRRRHWVGNCVAVGDTGTCLDALDAAHMQVLHSSLSHLAALFPVDRNDMPEARIYNAKIREHMTGLRDFQIAHYKTNRRFDDPLWSDMRDADVPDTLRTKLDLFESRGVIAMQENETFREDDWISILNGHGVVPESWDPRVARMPTADKISNFQRMLKFIASEVESMPSLQAHIEMNAPATSDYIF